MANQLKEKQKKLKKLRTRNIILGTYIQSNT